MGFSAGGSCCSSFLFPHLVVLHHPLQHGTCVLKNVSHALEQRNPYYAEEAHLQQPHSLLDSLLGACIHISTAAHAGILYMHTDLGVC